MLLRDVLDDRKPESRAAVRLAAALVHAVEPLEDVAEVRFRNADARIAHDERVIADAHRDRAVVAVVADRVVHEVVDQFIQKRTVAADHRRSSDHLHCHAAHHRGAFQRFRALQSEVIEIDRLLRRLDVLLVQLGQRDDVGNERQHAVGLAPDALGKDRHVPILRHAVFDHLRIAGDRGQRRLEFVRDVRGERAANALHAVLFADVVHGDDRRRAHAVLPHVVILQTHRMPEQFHRRALAAAHAAQKGMHNLRQIGNAVKPRALHMQQRARRGIAAQRLPFEVEGNDALLHGVQNPEQRRVVHAYLPS